MARTRGMKRAAPDASDEEIELPTTSGKSPKLRPKLSTRPPPAAETPTKTKPAASTSAKRHKRSDARLISTHRMRTRSKAKTFRLMELPAELRNNIYGHVLEASPFKETRVSGFELPPLLAVSKQVHSEALPIFFAEKLFTIRVRSNYCFRLNHFHDELDPRYKRAGNIKLSSFLKAGPKGLPKNAVRFRHVKFLVCCICCSPGCKLGSVTLGVKNKMPTVKCVNTTTAEEVAAFALEIMADDAAEALWEIKGRKPFNGFTVGDIVKVGKCFRVEDGEDRLEDFFDHMF